MVQILSHGEITILLSLELGFAKVILDIIEEFSHGNVIGGSQVLSHSDIILGLVEEFGDAEVVLPEELSHRDIVSYLLEVMCNGILKELSHSHVIGRSGQVLTMEWVVVMMNGLTGVGKSHC